MVPLIHFLFSGWRIGTISITIKISEVVQWFSGVCFTIFLDFKYSTFLEKVQGKSFWINHKLCHGCSVFYKCDQLRNSRSCVSAGRPFSSFVWWVMCWSQHWGFGREGKTSQVHRTHCVWNCHGSVGYHRIMQGILFKETRRKKNIGSKILPLFYFKSKSHL